GPLVVIFPDRESLVALERGRPATYAPLTPLLQAKGIPYLDLADAFLAPGTPFDLPRWFMPGGHYSPAGNRIVAAWLGNRLSSRFARCPSPRVRQSVGDAGGRRR